VTGLMAALYAPLMYYELILVRESAIVFCGLFLIWLFCVAQSRSSRVLWAALGAAGGIACLLKSTFPLLGFGLAAGLAWSLRRRPAQLAGAILGVSLGAAATLVPLIARNIAVGAAPVSLASSGAVGFVVSNTSDYLAGSVGFSPGGSNVARRGGDAEDPPDFLQLLASAEGQVHPGLPLVRNTQQH
jgi:hypothetical protein